MPISIEQLVLKTISNEEEIQIINEAIENEDYNLVRVIVDGTIDDFKRDFEHELLFEDIEEVVKILPKYKDLMMLDVKIMEMIC